MRQILIYADKGVGPLSLRYTKKAFKSYEASFLVKCVKKEELLFSDWEQKTSLIVFPGGLDTYYHEYLKGTICQKIRSFVEKGGCYLGVCAGAYYGAYQINFDEGGKYATRATRQLQFFEGTAVGPALGTGTYTPHDESLSQPVLLQLYFLPSDFSWAYYNGGCYFEGDLKIVTVLARYAELLSNPAAIIEIKVGKGIALLSGVHPELSPFRLNPELNPVCQDLMFWLIERLLGRK